MAAVFAGAMVPRHLRNVHVHRRSRSRPRHRVSHEVAESFLPATPIDWHRVAGSPTMAKMQRLGGFGGNAAPNKLYFPVFQATQENDFGITLADVLPTLTGERE